MQSPLRFLVFGTEHREYLHTEVCPCWTGRCQYLKQCPDHLSLNASSCHSERKDSNSWLLVANFQTVEWKPSAQEIKSFISDPRYGIDIRYSKGSLGCMNVFNQSRNDGHCSRVKSRMGLHIEISALTDLIAISNVFKFNVYLPGMCQDKIIPLKGLCWMLFYYRT